MIALTRRDGSRFWLNVHQVETVEATPETIVTLISGRKLVLRDTVEQVIEAAVAYRRRLGLNLQESDPPPAAGRPEISEEDRHGR